MMVGGQAMIILPLVAIFGAEACGDFGIQLLLGCEGRGERHIKQEGHEQGKDKRQRGAARTSSRSGCEALSHGRFIGG